MLRLRLRPPSAARLALSGAALSFALAAVEVTYGVLTPRGLTTPGLRVGGVEMPVLADETALRTWVARLAAARRGRPVRVAVGASGQGPRAEVVARLGDFGITYDVEATARRARSVAHRADFAGRLSEARAATRGAIEVPLTAHLDAGAARVALAPLTLAANVPAVSARVGFDGHPAVAAREGRYVDVEAVLASLERLAEEPAPTLPDAESEATASLSAIDAELLHIPARFTTAYVEAVDIRAVLASYETYFSRGGEQARRGQNIDVAAAKLDGLVLLSGELFSFNDDVGARSEENGFQRSWEILKGEMVEGVGGGTCQVASTLHAAAFFGGLDILERLPHSRPSAYIPMGLDATVVYPEVDMKLRNPFAFPVVLHAETFGNRLKIQLLGATKPATVSFVRELVESLPYRRKVEEHPDLRGHVVLKQHGIRGFKMKRVRTLTFADGQVKKEETSDRYPSTTEIYAVPPGFDVASLPPLPVEDEDDASDPGAAEASRVPSPSTPTPLSAVKVACTGACVPSPELLVVSAPGAHAPSDAQAHPPKTLTLRR